MPGWSFYPNCFFHVWKSCHVFSTLFRANWRRSERTPLWTVSASSRKHSGGACATDTSTSSAKICPRQKRCCASGNRLRTLSRKAGSPWIQIWQLPLQQLIALAAALQLPSQLLQTASVSPKTAVAERRSHSSLRDSSLKSQWKRVGFWHFTMSWKGIEKARWSFYFTVNWNFKFSFPQSIVAEPFVWYLDCLTNTGTYR